MKSSRAFVVGAVALLSGLSARAEPPPAAPPAPPASPVKNPDLERLATWMTGTFSSAAQARSTPGYAEARLTAVPIWKDRADGPWLFLAQAETATPGDGHFTSLDVRLRVFQLLHVGDSLFECRSFAVPDEAKAIFTWKAAVPLPDVTPAQLKPLKGCSLILRRVDVGTFQGSTLGSACESASEGTAYVTTELTVTPNDLIWWERAYDERHKQVWGSEKGPYELGRLDLVDAAPPSDPLAVERRKSKDNVHSLLMHYIAGGAGLERPWPAYSGKALVLWLVAANLLDRRDPKQLEALFSPSDGARSLAKAGGVEAYAQVTLESLKTADPRRGVLTSYVGRRNAERAHVITRALESPGVPVIADLSFPDGAIIGYTSGEAKWLTREELGLGPNDPIVAGDASKSPILRHLSSD